MSLNKIMLIGRTGDDVKLHHFENGGCIGRFSLATNESYINKQSNEKVTEVEWHNIVVRNKQAETLAKYLKKGDQVYLEGKNKTRKWQDKDGNDKYTTEVHVFSFTFLSNNSPNNNSGAQNQEQSSSKSGNGYTDTGDPNDIPF